MHLPSRVGIIVLAAACALSLAGCSPKAGPRDHAPKTIRWWHLNADAPGRAVFESVARDYQSAHPWVTIKLFPMDNMEFRPKLKLELAADDPPDIFHSWGGGTLAEQAKAGYLRDITAWVRSDRWRSKVDPVALGLYSYGGKVYGFPTDLGAVGFWYNSALLEKAGFRDFPADWEGFLAMCAALKESGIVPISLGIADRWPVMYYWVYLALRAGGPGLFKDILEGSKSFEDPALVEAGYMMRDIYRRGLLQRTAIGDDFAAQSRLMGDGECAVQLMGQWALALQALYAERRDELAERMRFAPFPSVRGGKGGPRDAMGGGNGFAIGKNAPDEAVELLEYFTRAEVYQRYSDAFPAVPTVDAVRVTNPSLAQVKAYVKGISSFCLYPDQMFPQELGDLINSVSTRMLLGELEPEKGCAMLAEAWKRIEAASR